MWGLLLLLLGGGRGPVPSCRGEAAQADPGMWTGDSLTGRSVFGLGLLLPCVLGEGEAGREGVASLLASRRCTGLVLSAGCPVISLTLTLITWRQHRPTGRGSAPGNCPQVIPGATCWSRTPMSTSWDFITWDNSSENAGKQLLTFVVYYI